jgi:hypothetical protein
VKFEDTVRQPVTINGRKGDRRKGDGMKGEERTGEEKTGGGQQKWIERRFKAKGESNGKKKNILSHHIRDSHRHRKLLFEIAVEFQVRTFLRSVRMGSPYVRYASIADSVLVSGETAMTAWGGYLR